ncbi:MAG: hypothetical protein K2Q26_04425 [Bdellovibrionales bacterium]|nr:hypothetical protein [Bdellovibrionales bacterium]
MNKNNKKVKNKQSHHLENTIIKLVETVSALTYQGLVGFFKKPRHLLLKIFAILTGGFLITMLATLKGLHLKFLHWLWPVVFNKRFIAWSFSIPWPYHYWGLFLGISWIYIISIGSKLIRQKIKIQKQFETIGLTNGLGETPKLISYFKINDDEEKYLFKGNSVSLNQFENKRNELEAVFQKPIEFLKNGSNPSIIELGLSNKRIPKVIHFDEIESKLKEEQFYVGDTGHCLHSQDLKHLPHMLIAGSTGGGKSVFFKQTIAGLLQSSSYLQIFLIDLKKGLEAADFKQAPNVWIAKDLQQAVYFLQTVGKEMERRFHYLEAKGYKNIEPQRDQMDRLLIAVDEASELYADKSKFDDDYELSQKAQRLTNSIARLGRAAGIHLILATQKVNKESINTVIQENISARMCFKMNTLQGSLQVLGSKDAMDLPMIPGRGIWQFGSEQFTVQVPLISEQRIKHICNGLKEDFANGNRFLFKPILKNDVKSLNQNSFKNIFVETSD